MTVRAAAIAMGADRAGAATPVETTMDGAAAGQHTMDRKLAVREAVPSAAMLMVEVTDRVDMGRRMDEVTDRVDMGRHTGEVTDPVDMGRRMGELTDRVDMGRRMGELTDRVDTGVTLAADALVLVVTQVEARKCAVTDHSGRLGCRKDVVPRVVRRVRPGCRAIRGTAATRETARPRCPLK